MNAVPLTLMVTALLFLFLTSALCAPRAAHAQEELTVTSPAFEDGGMIPARHSRRGGNVSPALDWSGAPQGVQSYALICLDPDAPGGNWVHWVIYNIPGDATGLAEGVMKVEELADGSVQGWNSWDLVGWDGPQPPSGVHRYRFMLYALDDMLYLGGEEPDRRDLEREMEGHVLAQGRLTGKFR